VRLRWRHAVPFTITCTRILLVPPLILLYLADHQGTVLVLYIVILLTDVLDGWLARRLNAVTRLGAMLDVGADILVVLAVLATLAIQGTVPAWVPLGPVLVAWLFLCTSARGKPRYDPIGKYYGTALFLLIGTLLWQPTEALTSATTVAIAVVSLLALVNRALFCMRRGQAN